MRAAGPGVLLLDEPTGPLDAAATAAVEELIAGLLNDGASALWITHDPAQAKRVAPRALQLEAGRMKELAA